jgi:heme oxygenase|tara:strand:- start:5455 stop:6138 length:684 start_codon:yes stop_codon:yes gene_type:complete
MQLSVELKQGTKESHNAAENGKFIAGFLRGVLNQEQYKQLLANFYYIYSAMEVRFDKLKDDPVLSGIYFPELHRKRAIEKDLKYYYGPTWREHICPSQATQQYLHRIDEAPPTALIGHHYTRYLGDLSGGQILKGIAKKALNPPVGEGLNFYDFKDIPDAKEFKTCYRKALDDLNLDDSAVNEIVAEANYAFRLNMFMFEEFEGSVTQSIFKVICSTIKGTPLFGGK